MFEPCYSKHGEISIEDMIFIAENGGELSLDERSRSVIVMSRMKTGALFVDVECADVHDKLAELKLFISLQANSRRFNQIFCEQVIWTRTRVNVVHSILLRYNILQEMERIELSWGPHERLSSDSLMTFEADVSREFKSLFDQPLSLEHCIRMNYIYEAYLD